MKLSEANSGKIRINGLEGLKGREGKWCLPQKKRKRGIMKLKGIDN